ncbi:MAG: retropepsin-like aspartic protease [Gammaproteobacteria bacterium]|nr:retropepsin-like aspartic protease [Gammaproteobacteria bacterium]
MIARFIFTFGLGALVGWFANGYWHRVVTTVTKIQKPVAVEKAWVEIPCIPEPVQSPQNPQASQASKNSQSANVIDIYAPEVLMVRSKIAIGKGDYATALIHLEDLLTQVQDIYPQKSIELMFVNISKRYIEQLGSNQPQQTIDFLNRVINILPNYLEFHYLLAQLFLTLENYSQVQHQLSFLANNIQWKVQFDQLQAQLNYAQIFQQGEITIPLIRLTNAWHIDVMVDNAPARLILDTGASITTLSEHLMTDNYQSLGAVTLSTANGTLPAFRVNIDTFSVGAVIKRNFPVVILPKEKLPHNIDGLLGLDWLSQFNFVIDKKNALLHLTPAVNF